MPNFVYFVAASGRNTENPTGKQSQREPIERILKSR